MFCREMNMKREVITLTFDVFLIGLLYMFYLCLYPYRLYHESCQVSCNFYVIFMSCVMSWVMSASSCTFPLFNFIHQLLKRYNISNCLYLNLNLLCSSVTWFSFLGLLHFTITCQFVRWSCTSDISLVLF